MSGKLVSALGRAYRQAQRVFQFLIGLTFMVMAGMGTVLSATEWKEHLDHPASGLVRFYLFAGFTLVLIFFCLYSFLKARSIR